MSVVFSAASEKWPSGRRRTPGKCVYGNVSRVRIPPSPPSKQKTPLWGVFLFGALNSGREPSGSTNSAQGRVWTRSRKV